MPLLSDFRVKNFSFAPACDLWFEKSEVVDPAFQLAGPDLSLVGPDRVRISVGLAPVMPDGGSHRIDSVVSQNCQSSEGSGVVRDAEDGPR
jgi:hypothetical protein